MTTDDSRPAEADATLGMDEAESLDSALGLFGAGLDEGLDLDWSAFGDDDSSALGAEPGGEIVLTLSDLISDDNNEVVIVGDSGLDALKLVTDTPVAGSGIADSHVTAAGQDVTGYHYVSFDTGLTLYYGDGIDLILEPVSL